MSDDHMLSRFVVGKTNFVVIIKIEEWWTNGDKFFGIRDLMHFAKGSVMEGE